MVAYQLLALKPMVRMEFSLFTMRKLFFIQPVVQFVDVHVNRVAPFLKKAFGGERGVEVIDGDAAQPGQSNECFIFGLVGGVQPETLRKVGQEVRGV